MPQETPLKRRRIQSGLLAIEVVARTGIEQAHYSRIENGWVTPRPDELRRIEKVLAEGPQPPQRGKE